MSLSRQVQEKLIALRNEQDPNTKTKMQLAVDCYFRRLRLQEEPEGNMRFGFWIPSANEHRYCCNKYLKIGLGDPKALYKHCKTYRHVSFLFGVNTSQLHNELRMLAETDRIRTMILEQERED